MSANLIDDILILSSACITTTLGVILHELSIPRGKKWKNLRAARTYLAISCFILAAINILTYLFKEHLTADQVEFIAIKNIIILGFASSQAMLFTMTLISLIQPLNLREDKVLTQTAIILSTCVVLLLFFFLWRPFFPVVFYIAIAAYIFQLVYYTILFNNKYKHCLIRLEAYYDEDESYRMKWIRRIFYAALSIGILFLSFLFLDGWPHNMFIFLYTTFYLYVVIRLLNYKNKELRYVLPAMIKEESVRVNHNHDIHETNNDYYMTERELKFKKALEEWVADKKFSDKDTGVEEIAQTLGEDISFLRYYFRTYIKDDFRTWRSELRINEARRLLEKNPLLPLSKVSSMVGFNDRGNFHRQFQKLTGVTPANYKEDCHEDRKMGCNCFLCRISNHSHESEITKETSLNE